MSMTQRYASVLRRHAGEWDKQGMPVKADCCRQAARHLEALQAKVDAIASPWQPMQTAPMDGIAVLALLEGSDVAHPVRWLPAEDKFAAGTAGWRMVWDLTPVSPLDGPRCWMPIPEDPEAQDGQVQPPAMPCGYNGGTCARRGCAADCQAQELRKRATCAAAEREQCAKAVPDVWLVKVRRLVAGFEHVAGLARMWEPDHSTGSERVLWARASEAYADVAKLLAEDQGPDGQAGKDRAPG